MRRNFPGFALALMFAVALCVPTLSATQIVINNPGFDNPVPGGLPESCCSEFATQNWASAPGGTGWDFSGPGDAGIWAPVAAFTQKNEELFLYPLSGDQVAYSNGGTISQSLSTNARTYTEYVVAVNVGLRSEYFPPFNDTYTISLIAGNSIPSSAPAPCNTTGNTYVPSSPCLLGQWTDDVYGSMNGNPSTGTPKFPLIRGGWQTIQFASQNLLVSGVPLIIQLSASSGQIDFENVTLQAFQVLVPEPGTYALMGSALLVLGLVLRRHRKAV